MDPLSKSRTMSSTDLRIAAAFPQRNPVSPFRSKFSCMLCRLHALNCFSSRPDVQRRLDSGRRLHERLVWCGPRVQQRSVLPAGGDTPGRQSEKSVSASSDPSEETPAKRSRLGLCPNGELAVSGCFASGHCGAEFECVAQRNLCCPPGGNDVAPSPSVSAQNSECCEIS